MGSELLAEMEEIGDLLKGVPDAESAPAPEAPPEAAPSEGEPPPPDFAAGAPGAPQSPLFALPNDHSPAHKSERTAPANAAEPPEPASPEEDRFLPFRAYLDAKGLARLQQIVGLIPAGQQRDFLMFVSHYRLHPDDAAVASAGLAALVGEAARDLPAGVDRIRKALLADQERFLREAPEILEGRSAALAGQIEEAIIQAHEASLLSLEERFSALLDAAREASAAAENSLKGAALLAGEAGDSARAAIEAAAKEMIPTMAEAFESSWDRGLERIKQAVGLEEAASRARIEEMSRKTEAALSEANRKALERALSIADKVARAEVASAKARALWIPAAIGLSCLALGALLASAAFLWLR